MAKGENIFKRKDGRWEARYVKGHDLAGKIKYGYCYGKNYREAKEKVQRMKAALVNGQAIPDVSNKHRLSCYCDLWLKSNRSKVKDSTYIKYFTVVEKHIKPKLGNYYPSGFTTVLVEEFRDELLLEKKLSPKTVKDILTILKAILIFATETTPGLYPILKIASPKDNKKEMRVLTLDEQTRFINFLMTNMDPCKFGIFLAMTTGIRIGELCALRWEHIYIEEKVIRILGTMQRLQNPDSENSPKTRVVIGPPKSETSQRIIPMTDQLVQLCRQMRPEHSNAFVLTGAEEYMEPRTLQNRLKKYTQRCGLEGVHFHALRHTFATRCIEVGFEIKSLSEILGHSTTTITLDRYVHSSMELKRDNMNKLTSIGM